MSTKLTLENCMIGRTCFTFIELLLNMISFVLKPKNQPVTEIFYDRVWPPVINTNRINITVNLFNSLSVVLHQRSSNKYWQNS